MDNISSFSYHQKTLKISKASVMKDTQTITVFFYNFLIDFLLRINVSICFGYFPKEIFTNISLCIQQSVACLHSWNAFLSKLALLLFGHALKQIADKVSKSKTHFPKHWGVSSTSFGIPFRLPVQFQNKGSSPFIICK